MLRRIYIILFLVVFTACDDGDIIVADLNFDQELDRCDNFEDSYLIFDTRVDPNESLSLIIPKDDANELLFTEPTPIDEPTLFTINENTIRFNYRIYNRAVINSDLCTVIPPADLDIKADYEAPTGDVIVTVTIEDDDNDGVPTEFEGRGELDENGEYSNAEDFDLDGIPDYLDEDDDNDNVKTIDEIDNTNIDGDNNPTTNPLDTDGNGNPNYLDADDDGDGTPTRLEDENGDKIPQNDSVVNADGINVVRYLYDGATEPFSDPGFIANEYRRTVRTRFLILNVSLGPVGATEIEFGTFESVIEDYPNSLVD
ncbi:hypothetical protein [Winogradskyella sp. UBA3174]|uniref:hypothetical protein n=1 Tax=Winogradskyella sp. UBA3174 TaxID=1947785 RepID=UPI0025E384AF|nr:hypothetical protein [Winogradskyella sp. UBA3174]